MGEQLSMLDTMFLELEQVDERRTCTSARRSSSIRCPAAGRRTSPSCATTCARGSGILPRFPQQLSGPHAGPADVADLGAGGGVRPRRPRAPRDAAGAGRRGRAARVARRLLVAPPRPPPAAVGDDAARRARGRALGAGHQDPPLPRRRRRLGRHRAPAARRLPGGAAAARRSRCRPPTRTTASTATAGSGSRPAWSCAARGPASARRCIRASRSTACARPSSSSCATR